MNSNPVIWTILLLHIFSNLSAQNNDDECKRMLKQYKTLHSYSDEDIDSEENPCNVLAIALQTELEESRLRMAPTEIDVSSIDLDFLTPRSLQTNKVNAPNSVAALNQSEAVPSLFPFALAGGSIGGTGSEGGANALTSISLNPAIFFTDMNDAKESAKWGRLMDLSVIFPLNQVEEPDLQKLSYLGLRGRINLTGVANGDHLYENVLSEFSDVLKNSEAESNAIERILNATNNCDECIKQFLRVINQGEDVATLSRVCGEGFNIEEGDAIFRSFKEELDKLLLEADRKYFGLDIRSDFGDPTLNAIDSASGTSLFLGVGYGFSNQRVKNRGASIGLNTRLGFRYKDMEDIESNIFDIDGAIGMDLAWPYHFQQIKLGLGVEFRANLEENLEAPIDIDLSEAYETDYLYFRLALNIPITPSNGISLQYGTSIAGEKASILSFNFSWNLLLADEN